MGKLKKLRKHPSKGKRPSKNTPIKNPKQKHSLLQVKSVISSAQRLTQPTKNKFKKHNLKETDIGKDSGIDLSVGIWD